MKSIQTKFQILIISSILMCALLIGGISIYHSTKAIDHDSAQIMNLQCINESNELNFLLQNIKQAVEILSIHTTDQLQYAMQNEDNPAYIKEYKQRVLDTALNIAGHTNGAIAVYTRYASDFSGPTSEFFWTRTSLNDDFQETVLTDLALYDPDDKEHVGWFYIPQKTGTPVWLSPYQNSNINVFMISYVIPLYLDHRFIGVVGMDIDFSLLQAMVDNIKVYDSGYAFLVDSSANVMYHPEIPMYASMYNLEDSLFPLTQEFQDGQSSEHTFPYTWKGQKKMMVFHDLDNEMRLAITAPASEINAARQHLIVQIFLAFFLVTVLFVFITNQFTRRLIHPLKELTQAAGKIAAGDLSIHISCQSQDEVGVLASSLQKTADHLKSQMEYINGLAFRDALTGAKNKAAYQNATKKLDEQIRQEVPLEFALAMLDINGLKYVNDTFGHEAGDKLIIDSCGLICNAFKHSPVFRIGGDEFTVVLQKHDYKNRQECLSTLEKTTQRYNENSTLPFQIWIAGGIAEFKPETDLSCHDVFNRADTAMYQNKEAMKQENRNSM